MKRYWITVLMLAATAPAAWGYDYQASTGALSYSVFNLSPSEYTLTPYAGGGGNPYSGWPAWTQGWDNADGTVGFFNPVKISASYDMCFVPPPGSMEPGPPLR